MSGLLIESIESGDKFCAANSSLPVVNYDRSKLNLDYARGVLVEISDARRPCMNTQRATGKGCIPGCTFAPLAEALKEYVNVEELNEESSNGS